MIRSLSIMVTVITLFLCFTSHQTYAAGDQSNPSRYEWARQQLLNMQQAKAKERRRSHKQEEMKYPINYNHGHTTTPITSTRTIYTARTPRRRPLPPFLYSPAIQIHYLSGHCPR